MLFCGGRSKIVLVPGLDHRAKVCRLFKLGMHKLKIIFVTN